MPALINVPRYKPYAFGIAIAALWALALLHATGERTNLA